MSAENLNFGLWIKTQSLFLNQNWEFLWVDNLQNSLLSLLALLLILFNLFFKITAAPFQFWAPSIYGKAPTISVTFISIFFKVIIFFIIFKLLFIIFNIFSKVILPILFVCSILSIIAGIIGAISEKITKRFFVFSSMGHVGFMLAGLSVSSLTGVTATFHYLPVYILTSFILWFTLFFLGREKNHLIDLAELKNSNMGLALIFSSIGFSMSGIPPLAGFFVKFHIFYSLFEVSNYIIIILLLILTVPSFFYYLRFIKIIWFDGENLYLKEDSLDLSLQNTNDYDFDEEGENLALVIGIFTFILTLYIFWVQTPLLQIESEILFALF